MFWQFYPDLHKEPLTSFSCFTDWIPCHLHSGEVSVDCYCRLFIHELQWFKSIFKLEIINIVSRKCSIAGTWRLLESLASIWLLTYKISVDRVYLVCISAWEEPVYVNKVDPLLYVQVLWCWSRLVHQRQFYVGGLREMRHPTFLITLSCWHYYGYMRANVRPH